MHTGGGGGKNGIRGEPRLKMVGREEGKAVEVWRGGKSAKWYGGRRRREQRNTCWVASSLRVSSIFMTRLSID